MNKKPSAPRKKKLKLNLKCVLTQDEKLAIGQTMAESLNEIGSLENDAKTMASDFKAKIASREATLNSDKNKLQSGYEYREIDCELEYDQPMAGKKTLVRLDSNTTVEITNMTDEEKQQSLPLEEQE